MPPLKLITVSNMTYINVLTVCELLETIKKQYLDTPIALVMETMHATSIVRW